MLRTPYVPQPHPPRKAVTEAKRQPIAKKRSITRRQLRKLKTAAAVLVAVAGSCAAQELPDHPKPQRITIDRALIASEVTMRALDVYSTHRALSAPCHCNYETDPIAPQSDDVLASVGFQAAMGAGVIVASHYAEHSRHKWLRIAGQSLMLYDVSHEVKLVAGNMELRTINPPVPAPAVWKPRTIK